MENPKTTPARFRPAKDRFSEAVYVAAGLLAFVELFAFFWPELW